MSSWFARSYSTPSSGSGEALARSSSGDCKLPYLCVGKISPEPIIIASVGPQDAPDTREIFVKLLHAARVKMAAGGRLRLQWKQGSSVCCLLDSSAEYLYAVVTASVKYPEPVAFELLAALCEYNASQMVNASADQQHRQPPRLLEEMHALLSEYDSVDLTSGVIPPQQLQMDQQGRKSRRSSRSSTSKSTGVSEVSEEVEDERSPAADTRAGARRGENLQHNERYQKVLEKTKKLQRTTSESIKSVLRNVHSMQALEVQTKEMEEASTVLESHAVQLKKHYWWKNKVFWVLNACMLVLIGVIAYYALVHNGILSWPQFGGGDAVAAVGNRTPARVGQAEAENAAAENADGVGAERITA